MALTISTLIDKGERTFPQQHGVIIKQADVTLGVATADYASGVDVAGNATKLGFRKVLAVLDAGVRGSTGNAKAYVDQYNYSTGKLQLFVPNIAATSATNLALAEIVASDHLANGDVVRMTLIGV